MKKTGFFRLFIRSLPEIWFCQVVIGAVLWFPMTALNTVIATIVGTDSSAMTTANMETILSPRAVEILACSFLMVLLLLVGEISAPICLCEAVQKQEKTGVFSIIKKLIRALPRFFTPSGFLILLYILFVSPLLGLGIYLSVTESLYIPRFITEVIDKSMTTAVLYRTALQTICSETLEDHTFRFHSADTDHSDPVYSSGICFR